MKVNIKFNICAMAMAIASLATPLTACSNEGSEVEDGLNNKPQTENAANLTAYAIDAQGTRATDDLGRAVFTGEDIKWFDMNTRELRFNIPAETIFKRLKNSDRMEFRLGDDVLFSVDNLVCPIVSRTYFDLVLYYEWMWDNGERVGERFYLNDCYPTQFCNEELTVNNRNRRAPQWRMFIQYLASKGKLRK